MVYQVTALKLPQGGDVTGCLGIHSQLHIVGYCVSEVMFPTEHGQAEGLGQLTSQEMLRSQL